MEIRVLGCSGSKSPGRLLTSFLVDGHILVDAGSAAEALELDEQSKITRIFVTHPHLDHIVDIAFIADNMLQRYIEGGRAPILVHALEPAIEAMQQHFLNGAIWPDFTVIPCSKPPVLEMAAVETGISYDIGGLQVTPFGVSHYGGQAAGYILEHEGRRVAYTGDSGPEDWPEILSASGGPIHDLITEVSFPNEMRDIAELSGHMTPELLRGALDKLPRMPNIYVTHIKSVGRERILEELQELFPNESVRILKEGDVLHF